MPWEAADGDGQILNRHPEHVPRHHARTGSHGDGDLCTCRRQLRCDLAGRIPGADDEDATPHVPIGPPVFDAVENAAGKAPAARDRCRARVRHDARCHHDHRRGELGTATRSNTPVAIGSLNYLDGSACADREIEPARVLMQVVEEVLA